MRRSVPGQRVRRRVPRRSPPATSTDRQMRETLDSAALSLLAGPSAGRDPVQAVDRDCDSGDRALDRRVRLSQSLEHFLSRRQVSPTPRARPARSASSCSEWGSSLSSAASIFRWDRCSRCGLLRALSPGRAGLAGRRPSSSRRWLCGAAARRGQRHPDRLSAAARLHHHADHADHLSLGLRSADSTLFEHDRGGISGFPILELHRRRQRLRHSERRIGLSSSSPYLVTSS